MGNYTSFSFTTRGYSHIVKGTVCEDASAHYDAEGVHIAVTSDGHGDRRCFRSDVGSKLAAKIAVEYLKVFASSVAKTEEDPKTENWVENLFNKRSAEAIGRQLANSIISRWVAEVQKHFAANPVTEEELSASGLKSVNTDSEEDILHIYGATLIAALLTERYLIVIHQGDGRCMIVHRDGTIDQPVPWDPRCEGRMTTSLCDSDAVPSARYYISDQREDPVIACFATSDGVEDSFETMDDANAYIGELTARYAEQGPEKLTQYLEGFLPDLSKFGSRDDVSIAAIIDAEAAAPFARKFMLTSELRTQEAKARRAANKLDSMFRKMEYLEGEYEKAKAKYEQATESSRDAARNVDTIAEKLKLAKLFKSNSESDCSKAKEAFLAVKTEYEEYKDRHQQFAAMLKDAEDSSARLRDEIAKCEIAELGKKLAPDHSEPKKPEEQNAEAEIPEAETAQEAETKPESGDAEQPIEPAPESEAEEAAPPTAREDPEA